MSPNKFPTEFPCFVDWATYSIATPGEYDATSGLLDSCSRVVRVRL